MGFLRLSAHRLLSNLRQDGLMHALKNDLCGTAHQTVEFRRLMGVVLLAGLMLVLSTASSSVPLASHSSRVSFEFTIPAIQGRGPSSPLVGRVIETQGAVTWIGERGFFIQDRVGDGDDRTSDGIFVFTSEPASVQVGQCVRLRGRVEEFDFAHGAKSGLGRTTTQIHLFPDSTQVVGQHCEVTPVQLNLPLQAGDDLERFEGMLVNVAGPLMVQQNQLFGRRGTMILAFSHRLQAPTHCAAPGTAALAVAEANARRILVLTRGSAPGLYSPLPRPWSGDDAHARAGDTIAALTGILDESREGNANVYRIHPSLPLRWTHTFAPERVPAVGGTLKVAAMNLENFFSTLNDGMHECAAQGHGVKCRGAHSATEFEHQRTSLVAQLRRLDADVIGLTELENNGTVALRALVDALNADGAASQSSPIRQVNRSGKEGAYGLDHAQYATVAPAGSGAGTDAIKVALIYNPSRVRPLGRALTDNDPVHQRPPLAQTFERLSPRGTKEQFTVVLVHFKSRRCEAAAGVNAEQGDLQGCWNQRRVLQARALHRFVSDVQRVTGLTHTLLIGDFNAYAREDPIAELASHGYTDLIERYDPQGYTFVYGGRAGRLDYALASPALAPYVRGAAAWHLNADEPSLSEWPACAGCVPARLGPLVRASDHDPIVLGLY